MNADNVQETGNPDETHRQADAQASEAAPPTEAAADAVAPETDLHASLLEGVSPEALTLGGASEAEAAEPSASAPEAAAPVEDLTVVATEPDPDATEAVAAAGAVVETVTEAQRDVMAQALAATQPMTVTALPDLRALMDVSRTPRITEVMDAFGEVSTTVMRYLRDEGTAALAHWQSLSAARTPADAIRIQVDEMQRAANASLSCFSALAQRASRVTGSAGRP